MNKVIKTAIVRDSKGMDHEFNLVRVMGGYTFTWDKKEVDWSFTVHGYNQAVWHKNESKLKIGKSPRSPFVMFKYIYFNSTFPIVGGNKNLGFSFTKKVKTNMFDDEFNYSDFRIPL